MESKKIKKGDFVELEYTGKIKDENKVFDTTKKEVAIANNLNKEADYKPIVVCIGEGYILQTLEAELEGKKLGKYTFELSPEQAFGKKSAQLLKLVPIKVFKQQDIMPYPGLEVNIDNRFGIIRNVSGGRVIVDFNHPLSGRDLTYDVEVKRFVNNDKEKLESLLRAGGIHFNSASVKEKKAMIVLEHEIPDEIKKAIDEKIKKTIGTKKIDYITKKQEKKKSEQQKSSKK
ncbi:MAG: peptidylprolyl isomerase [DPANN group archaeon]|nr:peptidylprolyl isomerase [DPANN group archaeon]